MGATDIDRRKRLKIAKRAPSEKEVHKPKSKHQVKKRYILECKFLLNPDKPIPPWRSMRWYAQYYNWHKVGSYKTERALDDAYNTAVRTGGMWGRSQLKEYRKVLPPSH